MKNRLEIVILLGLLVLLIAAAAFGYQYLSESSLPQPPGPQPEPGVGSRQPEGSATDNAAPGQQSPDQEPEKVLAPDFTVFDAGGNEVTLGGKKGKPVVVNFWASWCGPCKAEMPAFEEAYKQHGGEIEFMMVNLADGQRETVEKAQQFIDESGYTFPVYFDSSMQAALTYSVYSIPQTVFVDADGNVVIMYIGMMPEEVLASELQKLLPQQ